MDLSDLLGSAVGGLARLLWWLLCAGARVLWELWWWGLLPDTRGGRAARWACRLVVLAAVVAMLAVIGGTCR